jgi:hypothetical protein
VTGFSIFADTSGRGVLLGTSDKGRIYDIGNDARETLALQTETGQVSKLFNSGANLFAASSNQGQLFRIGPDLVSEGTYESAVLDAKAVALWGSIWWDATGDVRVETRSGNTEIPSETWSPWEPVVTVLRRGKVRSPVSQFVQWRAILKTSSARTALGEVNLAFHQRNIAPEVLSISLLPPNIGLISNPPLQIDPNIELSGIDPALFGIPVQPVPPRRAYLRGARAFQWTAEDRNGDKLVYDVYFKESSDASYKLLAADIPDNFYSIDGLSLADGRYTVKVVAKDSPSNPVGQFLAGEIISEPFDIDNTQPVVTVFGSPQVIGERGRLVFAASDKSSYLVRAEYSVNGAEWRIVYADDGISDSPEERYTVEIPLPAPGEYSVTLRVFDSAGNIGNARAVVRR